MMRVDGLVELSLLMMRKNNDRKNTMLHQPTLVGLWQREEDNGDDPATSREKKRIRVSSIETFPQNTSPPPPSPRWENISLPNGPMYLLRGCIGGNNSLERRLTRESLASLPDWNENVKFKIFGKDCQMRRVSVSIPDGDGDHHAAFTIIPHHLCILINKQRICQYSTGGKVSYSYSGLHFDAPEFPEILYDIKCAVETLIRDYILHIVQDETASQKNLVIAPEFIHLLQSTNQGMSNGEEIFNYCLCNHYRSGQDNMGYHADDEATLDPAAPIASVSLGITRSFDIRPRKKTIDGKKSRVGRISLGDGDLLLMLSPMQQHYEHSIPIEKRILGERINLTFRRIRT